MRKNTERGFADSLYTLTNFPLGLKVVSEKLYLSDAMFSWSQISEMMEMEDDEERGKNIPRCQTSNKNHYGTGR